MKNKDRLLGLLCLLICSCASLDKPPRVWPNGRTIEEVSGLDFSDSVLDFRRSNRSPQDSILAFLLVDGAPSPSTAVDGIAGPESSPAAKAGQGTQLEADPRVSAGSRNSGIQPPKDPITTEATDAQRSELSPKTLQGPAYLPIEADIEEDLKKVLNEFPELFRARYHQMLCHKIGLVEASPENLTLAQEWLEMMRDQELDYTNAYLALRRWRPEDLFESSRTFDEWLRRWKVQIAEQGGMEVAQELMDRMNPARIPRNHMVEAALDAASAGEMRPFYDLLEQLQGPYNDLDGRSYQEVPEDYDLGYKTYCGT